MKKKSNHPLSPLSCLHGAVGAGGYLAIDDPRAAPKRASNGKHSQASVSTKRTVADAREKRMHELRRQKAVRGLYLERYSALKHREIVDDETPEYKVLIQEPAFDWQVANGHEFVMEVLATDEPGFELSDGTAFPKQTSLSKWMPTFRKWMKTLDQEHWIFSPEIELLRSVWSSRGWPYDLFIGDPRAILTSNDMTEAQLFNDLVESIRDEARSENYRAFSKSREQTANRHSRRIKRVTDTLFARHSKLCAVRIDLSYRKDVAPSVTLAQAKEDMQHMQNNRRHNAVFEHLVGYAWRLEYTQKKGYHYHVALFFDGSKIHKDAFYAQKVIEYWATTVTRGTGIGHNCHLDKAGYPYLGVGLIRHDDQQMRTNMLKALKYLAKADQFLVAKRLVNERIFMAKVLPKTKSNAGRPRSVRINQAEGAVIHERRSCGFASPCARHESRDMNVG